MPAPAKATPSDTHEGEALKVQALGFKVRFRVWATPPDTREGAGLLVLRGMCRSGKHAGEDAEPPGNMQAIGTCLTCRL
jgi:hypothetical protein